MPAVPFLVFQIGGEATTIQPPTQIIAIPRPLLSIAGPTNHWNGKVSQ